MPDFRHNKKNHLLQFRFLFVLALCGLLSACFWENYSKTEKVYPLALATPASAAELVELVAQASSEGRRIRMTGSGHSHSDVAVTSDYLLTPTNLDQPLVLDRQRLMNPDAPSLVRVQSGIRLRELNPWLEQQGLALQNMGGYDAQTIVGAAMTGTHGSGLDYGPIASQILSMQVVGEGGQMLQIEPTDGITAAGTFPGVLEEDPAIPVQLIQDDDIFNAMVVSIGSMGVVYSVVLQVEPKFWLNEIRTLTTWEQIKAPGGFLDRVMNGLPVDGQQPLDYYELQYNPYEVDGERSFLITARYKSYVDPQGDTVRGEPGTDALSGLITVVEKPLAWLVKTFPSLTPLLIEQSLKSQRDDNGYSNVSYKVFNIGVVNNTDAIAVEVAFDLSQSVEAIERAFELGEQMREQGLMHSAPVSIRFVQASDALIAPQYGRPTVIIEFIVIQDVEGSKTLLSTYEQTLMEEFDGRLHWGLDLSVLQGQEWPGRVYPRWQDWLQIYRQFNAGTFDGKVTDRLGISIRPQG